MMKDPVSHRDTCRLCGSRHVERVVSLKPIPLSENYSTDRNVAANKPRYPVDVYMCGDCGHVQHLDVINPEVLWDSYTYFSGNAKGMPEHFQQMAEKFVAKTKPPAGSLVIDIGSNDGSLLKPFKQAGYRVLGIDPATDAVKRANDAGVLTIESLMTRDLARRIRESTDRRRSSAHSMSLPTPTTSARWSIASASCSRRMACSSSRPNICWTSSTASSSLRSSMSI